jgi:hypothetical protein
MKLTLDTKAEKEVEWEKMNGMDDDTAWLPDPGLILNDPGSKLNECLADVEVGRWLKDWAVLPWVLPWLPVDRNELTEPVWVLFWEEKLFNVLNELTPEVVLWRLLVEPWVVLPEFNVLKELTCDVVEPLCWLLVVLCKVLNELRLLLIETALCRLLNELRLLLLFVTLCKLLNELRLLLLIVVLCKLLNELVNPEWPLWPLFWLLVLLCNVLKELRLLFVLLTGVLNDVVCWLVADVDANVLNEFAWWLPPDVVDVPDVPDVPDDVPEVPEVPEVPDTVVDFNALNEFTLELNDVTLPDVVEWCVVLWVPDPELTSEEPLFVLELVLPTRAL